MSENKGQKSLYKGNIGLKMVNVNNQYDWCAEYQHSTHYSIYLLKFINNSFLVRLEWKFFKKC